MQCRYGQSDNVKLTFLYYYVPKNEDQESGALKFSYQILFDNNINPFRDYRKPVIRRATVTEIIKYYILKLIN